MKMKKTFKLKRFLIAVSLISLLGSTFGQVSIAHAEENSVFPKSDLVKISGSSNAVVTALASCAINVGIYFLLKALQEVVDDGKGTSILITETLGANSAAGRGSQATQLDYFKNVCVKPVEKAAAQQIIKSINQKSIAWITNGLSSAGGSVFPHDVNSIFADMQKQAISNFTSTFAFDDTKYPFGKDVTQSLITDLQTSPAKAIQYNLDKSISAEAPGKTAADFASNFQNGSWAAFKASLDTNNNPVGFDLAAQDILDNKLHAKNTLPPGAQDIKDQLQRNGGLLDLRKCADPSTYDPNTSPGLVADAQAIIDDQSGEYSDAEKENAQEIIDKNTCDQWQTTTPGSIAASQLTMALGSPIRQLESGTDLSSMLTSIFDAEVNQLITKGLTSLDSTSSANTTGTSAKSSTTSNGTTTEDTKQWYDSNPEFNILTDIPHIIDIENQYIDALTKQTDVLNKTVPAVYQLDLCIPGPRPNWDIDATKKVTDYLSKLGDPVCTSFTSHTTLGVTTSTDDNGPCGPMKTATGLDVEADPIKKPSDFSSALQAIVERYKKIMKDNYGPAYLPSEAYQAKKEYQKLALFQQEISQAADDMSSAKGVVHAMQVIKSRLDALPDPSDSTYNAKLTALKTTFDRSVANLHTQADLDAAVNMLGIMQDEYNTITEKDNGLIDQCYKETSDPAYIAALPVTRLPYPKDMNVTDPRATYTKTFLPDFSFGDGTGKTLKIDDILTQYHGSSSGFSTSSGFNVFTGGFGSVGWNQGNSTDGKTNGVDFSTLENFLGIY